MLTIAERQKLVEDYIPLANKLAWVKKKSTPPSIQIDELKSAAYMGLVDAVSRYDGGKFNPTLRIVGEMKDYLRSLSWGSKPVSFLEFDVEARAETRPDGDLFGFAARNLSPLAREAVFMYYFRHMTLREIGRKVGLSVGRISQIITASLELMRQDEELKEMAA